MRIELRRALKENDKDKIEVVKQSPDGKMTSRERERETGSNLGKFSEYRDQRIYLYIPIAPQNN